MVGQRLVQISLAVAALVACENAPERHFEVGQEQTVQGEVLENTIDPCVLPDQAEVCVHGGGFRLLLEVDGREIRVLYGATLGMSCEGVRANEQAEATRIGDVVEVFGRVLKADTRIVLSVCESSDFYVDQVGD